MGWGDVANGKSGATPARRGGWGGVGNVAVAPEHHQGGGGGLFGFVGRAAHWTGAKAGLAAHDIAGIPGGLYTVAGGVTHDIVKAERKVPGLRTFAPARAGSGKWQSPGIARGFAKQSVQSIEHPLRDPFQTLLTVAPFVGTAGRVGEAGIAASDAARAGEGGLAAARVAGKTLVRHGAPPDRVLRVGEEKTPVNLLASKNAGVRLAQRGYDRMVQKALDRQATGEQAGRVTNRLAKHGMKRAAGALAEEQRITQRLRLIPADMLDKAAGRLSKIPATRRLQQAALELTSTQTPAEEAAAFHYGQVAKGVNPRQNFAVAKLYERVAKRNLVHVDEARPTGEKVYINPEHGKLAAADARLAGVQARGDSILAEHGVLTPEEAQTRINKPGQIRAGGHYEAPTPGKLGVPSDKLEFQRAETKRLQGASDRAQERVQRLKFTAADRKRIGDMNPPVDAITLREQLRPLDKRLRQATEDWNAPAKVGGQMTEAEAHARLAELDKLHQQMLEKMVPHTSPYVREVSRAAPERATRMLDDANKRLADLASIDEWAKAHGGIAANDSAYMDLVQTSARQIKWEKFPTKRDAVLDYWRRAAARAKSQAKGKVYDPEQLRRNTAGGKGGKYGKMKTVKQEELSLAEDKLHQMIGKNPDHPVLKQASELIRERDQLRRTIGQRQFARLGNESLDSLPSTGGTSPYEERAQLHRILRKGTTAEKAVGAFAREAGTEPTVHGLNDLKEQAANLTDRINELRGKPGPEIKDLRRQVAGIRKAIRAAEAPRSRLIEGERPHVITPTGDIVRPIGQLRADRIGAALSVAKDKLEQLEGAAARREKPTGIVGGEQAFPGRGFVSERVSQKRLARAEAASSRGKVVPEAQSPIDSKSYTGRALEQGLRPEHVTTAVSQHFRQIARFEATDALRRGALKTGSAVRRSPRDILIRQPEEDAGKITADMRQILGQEKSTIDTPEERAATQEGLSAALRAIGGQWFDQAKASKTAQVGVRAPDGYRWVDENVVRGLQDELRPTGGPGAGWGRAIDNVNSAITALTVYFKIGHVGTRVFTNAATNIMQGSLRPDQGGKSWALWHQFGDEDRARMLAASGQHGFAALPHEGTSKVSRFAGWGAKQWAQHADAPFRFNSLAYEFRKAGYSTVPEVKRALDALSSGGEGLPAHEWSKISAAARRADREAIAYDRLNPFEKRFLTRAVWFYPWVKGSTMFTVRSVLEHPWKMAALGAAGVQGRERQQQILGDVPSYEEGLVPLGKGSHPLTTDFSTFSPFSTAGGLLNVPRIPGAIAGQFNPVFGAAGQLAYGVNAYGGPSKNPAKDAAHSLFAPTPEQQIAEAYAGRHSNQSQRMFQKTPGSTLLRYLVGPAMPRRVNRAALAKAAKRERSGQR